MYYLEKKYFDEMVSHALSEAPNECCGILAAKNGRVCKLYRTTNAEHSPTGYNVEPNELIQIYQEIEENKWELHGIYHSHINHEAYPSPVDIKYAHYPQAFYLIISLKDAAPPVLRIFTIREGEVTEQDWKII